MRLFEGTKWDKPPVCDACQKLETECQCPPWVKNAVPLDKQTARVQVENRPGGKKVTVVRGLLPTESDLDGLLRGLKEKLAIGGTRKDDSLELQGDQLPRVKAYLVGLGYRCK